MSRSSPIPPTMRRCWPSSTPTAAAPRSSFRKQLAAKAYALTAAYDSTISQWFAFADQGERWPETWTLRQHAQDAAALRREPAPAGGALPAGRPARARHRPGRAGAGQGAQLQQSQRRQCRARAGRRVPRRPTRRSSSSSTPTRAASRRADSLLDAWNEALACDSVSAFGGIVATNRPLDAATAEAITEIFTEVVVAPDADEEAQGDLRPEEEFAPAADRRAARSGARRPEHRGHRRRHPGSGPRQRHGHPRPAQVRHEAPADRAGSRATACSPGPSPSTSSRTRSSMPRTASPPASARAR